MPSHRLLWSPSEEDVSRSNVSAFIDFVNRRRSLELTGYFELYDWSIENVPQFWSDAWDFLGIKSSRPYDAVVDDLSKFPGARWFVGARLNFAENLLRHDDGRVAIVQRDESLERDVYTYRDLHLEVARYREFLKEEGVGVGDRVVAYMPNVAETVICMLAATSLGAIWASTGTEMGYTAVVDRLGQLEPKVLVTVDSSTYKGRTTDLRETVTRIARA
ncbi:MAG: AMP-binding protein, partial [Nitrososphaeria archaeon]|nr:AMP-binding protein [Nitrososphaeria archaeon]